MDYLRSMLAIMVKGSNTGLGILQKNGRGVCNHGLHVLDRLRSTPFFARLGNRQLALGLTPVSTWKTQVFWRPKVGSIEVLLGLRLCLFNRPKLFWERLLFRVLHTASLELGMDP